MTGSPASGLALVETLPKSHPEGRSGFWATFFIQLKQTSKFPPVPSFLGGIS